MMDKKKLSDENSEESSFPSLKVQDLTLFARKIQLGDNEWIQANVPANPRYLVTSSDSPTILHEGFRYNALHIAARWGNFYAAQLVLSAVSSGEFMTSLYPDDDDEKIRNNRTRYLTDMYLNTPDKGALETPLHFACKFNWYDVANLFIWHPACDLTLRNGIQQTAKEITGTRAKDPEIMKKIKDSFDKDRIVPLWRDRHGSQPVVGKMVNPKCLGENTPAPFISPYNNIVMDFFGPVDKTVFPKAEFGTQWSIVGYAGPMSEKMAEQFYNTIKKKDFGNNSYNRTPPIYNSPPTTPSKRDESFGDPFKTPVKTPTRTPIRTPRILEETGVRLTDPEKGMERVARKYAREVDVPWVEHWSFLNSFVDLYSSEGLQLLEQYLADQEQQIEPLEKAKFLGSMAEVSFHDCRTSPYTKPEQDNFVDCFSFTVFVTGSKATKEDSQLLKVITLLDLKVLNQFPAISCWYNSIICLGKDEIRRSNY